MSVSSSLARRSLSDEPLLRKGPLRPVALLDGELTTPSASSIKEHRDFVLEQERRLRVGFSPEAVLAAVRLDKNNLLFISSVLFMVFTKAFMLVGDMLLLFVVDIVLLYLVIYKYVMRFKV